MLWFSYWLLKIIVYITAPKTKITLKHFSLRVTIILIQWQDLECLVFKLILSICSAYIQRNGLWLKTLYHWNWMYSLNCFQSILLDTYPFLGWRHKALGRTIFTRNWSFLRETEFINCIWQTYVVWRYTSELHVYI